MVSMVFADRRRLIVQDVQVERLLEVGVLAVASECDFVVLLIEGEGDDRPPSFFWPQGSQSLAANDWCSKSAMTQSALASI